MSYLYSQKGSYGVSNFTSICVDAANNRLFCGCAGYVYMLSFNGTTFTKIGNEKNLLSSFSPTVVGFDGTYYYCTYSNGSTYVLSAFSFNGTDFTLLGTYSLGPNYPYSSIVCSSDGYIFIMQQEKGTLFAFTFNGSTFTLVASYDSPDVASYVWSHAYDGIYHYITYLNGTSKTGLQALSFNGVAFSSLATVEIDNYTNTKGKGLVHTGTYIVTVANNKLWAYSFNGSSFSKVGNEFALGTTTTTNQWLEYDGQFYYLITGAVGIRIFTFNGTDFTELSPVTDSSVANTYGNIATRLGGYLFFARTSSNGIYAARMDLSATFTASKLSGFAPLTINFTAT
jgi:hypothetical protein